MNDIDRYAQRLMALDEDEFLDAVEADLHDANALLGEALAHPSVCGRWLDTLKLRIVDVQNQLCERRPVGHVDDDEYREYRDWRRRAVRYQQTLLERRTAAKGAVQAAAREPKSDRSSRRRDAAERATNRLIDAHREEFHRYLDEEISRDEVAS